MAGRFTVDLSGDAALIAKLNVLPRATSQKAFRKVFREVGRKVIGPAIKTKMPKLTGALRRAALTFKAGKTRRQPVAFWIALPTRRALARAVASVAKRRAKKDPTKLAAVASKEERIMKGKYYYPAHVEYGHGKVPPHPFLRPAYDAVEAGAATKIVADVWAAIEREFLAGPK